MRDGLFIKDKKGIYKDKKEWVGLGRVMGGVGISGIGGFWDFGGRIGGVEGSVWRQGVWIVFINGSRAAVSTTAALLQTANFALLA